MSGVPDLLATIVAATRRAVAAREQSCPAEELQGRRTRAPQGEAFARALRDSSAPRVIAECKRRSPSRGILRADYDPAAHATAYAAAGAAAISVLTEPTFFDGTLTQLQAVRAAVTIPVLRKDFIVTEYQLHEAVVAGADAVLLIVGALDAASLRTLHASAESLGLAVLVEVHDREELERAVDAGARIIGVNSRNLRTLAVNVDVFEELAPIMPAGAVAVAESGIRTPEDIRRFADAGFSAFLVGERLIAQQDPGAALRALRIS